MFTLAAHDLLNAWERALGQPAPMRVVPLLAAATGAPSAEVARWSIARRDAALFELRERVFGQRADAVGRCPECGQELEFEVDLPQLRPDAPGDVEVPSEAIVDGHRVRYRRPNTEDLEAIAGLGSAGDARAELLARCIESVAPSRSEAPPAVASQVAQLISDEQAAAEVRLSLTCPECQHAWRAPFDIASFLWSEIEEWAWRTLRQVHRLARAYGWSETDVLRLSPRRRQTYLDLLDGDA